MTDVIFTNSVARGRNGWFKMAAASISVCSKRVIVNIVSKREVVPGPVFLELDAEDAVALGRELLRQAGQEYLSLDSLAAKSRSGTKRVARSKAESVEKARERA